MTNWADIVQVATTELTNRNLNGIYQERLNFELAEIKKQGAEFIWVNRVNEQKRFASNPNKLLLPWLLKMVDDDPISDRSDQMLNTTRAAKIAEHKGKYGKIPHDIIKDPDNPDIDIDCLPAARDPLKEYAIKKYGQDYNDGYGSVCSVGTWQAYKFKSAVIDAAVALGELDRHEVEKFTTLLPDDVNELKDNGKSQCRGKMPDGKDCKNSHDGIQCDVCGSTDTDGPTIGKLLEEFPALNQFKQDHPKIIDAAVNLVGRLRNMGMHAGAIIITNRPLYGNIPLAKSGSKGYWVSMWTEGRNTQLSKFGYIKWDFLGLKTLDYLFRCCGASRLIEENRGISFGTNMSGWDDIDPSKRRAGHFFDSSGNKHYIDLDDKHALDLANAQQTDGIFQFDTDLAKSILSNGVRSFEDLLFFNAAGHPGPMAAIPEAVANRDDTSEQWKKKLSHISPILLEILQDTYGIVLWQEQLAAILQRLGGFTATEAQDARKAVAKKWVHKLKPIGEKWLDGAARSIGEAHATALWAKLVTFGRYAFNKSHGVAYCLIAHRCLWLKAHFAPEWWAAVMSICHPDKLVRYMGVARAEGWKPTDISHCGKFKETNETTSVKFSTINIDNMAVDFTVTGDSINQGLIGIKGIGEKAAAIFQGRGSYANIDDFVLASPGRIKKTVLERFIKLGAFSHLKGHENTNALWQWYKYRYCRSGKGMTAFRSEIRDKLLEADGWTEQKINEERARQSSAWRQSFPKKHKIPAKIKNWMPKIDDTRENIMALYKEDFTLAEKLEFQKQFLGYWLDSPMDLYECDGSFTIDAAKQAAKDGGEVKLEVILLDPTEAVTKKGAPYLRLPITDGISQGLVFIWSNELVHQDFSMIKENFGVSMYVNYDEKRGTFSLARGENVQKLMPRGYKLTTSI